MAYIGITERGDAGLDLTWFEKAKNSDACVGVILITKAPYNKKFQEKAIELSKTKPVIIHAGITGWGKTPMEPIAWTPNESLTAVRNFIDSGFPADNIVLRIDPIIPTPEGIEKATSVITLAQKIIPDVKRIRISIYDDYHKSREEMTKRGYLPIDNVTKWKNQEERRPTPTQVNMVANALLKTASPNQIFELCAEPELATAYPEHFKWFGCLSTKDCQIMNIPVPPGVGINGQNRFGCRCLRMKKELLTNKKRCPHNCAYCYWGQN